MRPRFSLLALLIPMCVHGQQGTWIPKVEFTLPETTSTEVLIWISGYSYALTEAGRGGSVAICLPRNGVVESRVLLEALNARFKGQRVTPEQAAAVMYAEAKARYKC